MPVKFIKLCPFCGSDDIGPFADQDGSGCMRCGARAETFKSMASRVSGKVVGAELKPITGMTEIEAWRWLEKRPSKIEYIFEGGKFDCVCLEFGVFNFCGTSVLSVVLNARAELRKRGLPDE